MIGKAQISLIYIPVEIFSNIMHVKWPAITSTYSHKSPSFFAVGYKCCSTLPWTVGRCQKSVWPSSRIVFCHIIRFVGCKRFYCYSTLLASSSSSSMGTSQATACPQPPIPPKIDSGIRRDWRCTPKLGTDWHWVCHTTVLHRLVEVSQIMQVSCD